MIDFSWALPVLLTALIGSIIYRKHKDKEIFNDTAVKFRDEFANELTIIKSRKQGDTPEADQILSAAFQKHAAAVERFRPFLSPKDIPAFNKTWNEYHKDEDGNDAWYQYAEECTGLHDKYPHEPHLMAIERIENLLKLARQK